jgi:class 3 adenylate cyclase
MDGFIPIDTMEGEPGLARTNCPRSSCTRLIRFDRRGIGLSDPVAPSDPPTLEQWVDDAIAVLDAVGSEKTVVLGSVEASPVALLLTALHPDRVEALVLVNAFPRALVDDDYPEGVPLEMLEEMLDSTNPNAPGEAEQDWIAAFAPSRAGDEQFRQWWEETGRRGASPATARALLRVAFEGDVRSVLPTISCPTLLVQFTEHPALRIGQYLADHIERSRLVEITGADDYWWGAEGSGAAVDEIEEFLTGVRGGAVPDRVLATVLFSDIVGSTERASALGDRRWRDLLDRHDAAVRRQIARFRGREVKTTGDGFLATFDGPARAVECAGAIRDAARQLDLEVRSGVHTGEVERRGDDIGGIGVHIAARVSALAQPSTIWVSRTVTDLVVGSGLRFTDRGDHELKGVPGTWHLYEVEA